MLPDLLPARAGLVAGRHRAAALPARSRACAASEAVRPAFLRHFRALMDAATAVQDARVLDVAPSVERALAVRGE